MGRSFRPIAADDRLSIVGHLSELRARIIVSALIFATVFGLCLWQNDLCLKIINLPLEKSTSEQKNGGGPLGSTVAQQRETKKLYAQLARLSNTAAAKTSDGELKREFQSLTTVAKRAGNSIPSSPQKRPVTLGVGEPFTATLQVALYAALLFSLPLLLYQVYAFVLPALSKRERDIALPVVLSAPLLFFAGIAFAYFVVLPRAIHFLQNFNGDNFDILLQAREYYGFSIVLMGLMGIIFQVPLLIFAIVRLGIVTPKQLRANRRYAVLGIAILAMFLPAPDPVSMLIAMVPLVLLYEASILLATALERRVANFLAEGDEPDEPTIIQDPPKDLVSL